MESTVHRDGGAVGEVIGPAPDAPTDVVFAFDDVHSYAAFGQAGGRCESGDTGTDDDYVWARREQCGVVETRGCAMPHAPRIDVGAGRHRGPVSPRAGRPGPGASSGEQ